MTNVVCQDCDIEYAVKSKEAEEDGIIPAFCPFCGFETTDELDFDDPVLKTSDDEDDWDNWHPDDRFD